MTNDLWNNKEFQEAYEELDRKTQEFNLKSLNELSNMEFSEGMVAFLKYKWALEMIDVEETPPEFNKIFKDNFRDLLA